MRKRLIHNWALWVLILLGIMGAVAVPPAINYWNKVGTSVLLAVATNVDFQKYKAIAMACDNGAAFPATPNPAQWFYRTDIDTLYLYEGAWKPIISFGGFTVYLDAAGSDSNDGLTSGAGGAKLTFPGAWSAIPPNYGGDIKVQVTGTITVVSATVLIGKQPTIPDTEITIEGIEGALNGDPEAAFTSSAINAATGTVTKAGATWPVNGLRGLILKNVTNDWETIIFENTASIITVVGDLHGTAGATDDWEVREFGGATTAAGYLQIKNDNTNITRLKMTVTSGVGLALNFAASKSNTITLMYVDTTALISQSISYSHAAYQTIKDVLIEGNGHKQSIGFLVSTLTDVSVNRVGVYNIGKAYYIYRKSWVIFADVCKIDLNNIANSYGFFMSASALECFGASANSVLKSTGGPGTETGFSCLLYSTAYNNGKITVAASVNTTSVVDATTTAGIYTP